jgi:alkanesulfonate monooxygenase SsuD/methylene tetrahydromethanopterin reductase-like flavin-dependent oxidoreductase (luciferase family)
MKLGFFTMPMHPTGKDWRTSLAEDRDAIVLCDRLGYSEAYVGEHTTDPDENITSSAIFLATLAHATQRIRLGTGTINVPTHHPAATAAQLAMLDHLLDGRLNVGISPGALPADAEIFDQLDRDRPAMFLEAIDHVIALWTTDPPYRRDGRFWKITTERMHVPETGMGTIAKPLQRPHPPILVTAVAPHSKGVAEAAARGWTPISANFLHPTWVKTHWAQYEAGCARGDRPALAADWRVAKTLCVAADDAAAERYVTDPNGPYHYYYRSLMGKLRRRGAPLTLFKRDASLPDSAVTVERVVDELVIRGSPAKVADRILAMREDIGDFGTLLYAGIDWQDRDLGRNSLVLMAEQVMPRVNAAIA